MHADQLSVSHNIVRELIDDQFPSWRYLAIAAVEPAGTVNAIFRIGDRFTARFPLRPEDAASVRRRLESEAAAAEEVTCAPTTGGCRPASSAARRYWTFRGFAGCGTTCARCRAARPVT